MEISDWIQMVGILLTLVFSSVAVWQSYKSIKLTEKSIKDANRPYLSVYIELIDTVYFSKEISIKNFGNTSAKILAINIEGVPDNKKKEINFSSLIDGSIAPKQKFSTSLDDDFKDTLYFDVSYQEMDGTFCHEKFTVKTDIADTLLWSTQTISSDSPEATAIKKATHAIIKAFR